MNNWKETLADSMGWLARFLTAVVCVATIIEIGWIQ